jgi:hypothetical protein
MKRIFLLLLCISQTVLAAYTPPLNPGLTFNRRIRNASDVTWRIENQASFGALYFDHAPHRGPAACDMQLAKDSKLFNGPCYLPPGAVTYVTYLGGVKGRLIFDTLQSSAKPITHVVVGYQGTITWGINDSLSMHSSDESKINDNHGDITIYPGANY